MFFREPENYRKCEVRLVKTFLETLIGKKRDHCRKVAEQKEFIFLDSWEDKMGFVKEKGECYIILSLQFEDSRCHYYQALVKYSEEKWVDSKTIDYDSVRKTNLIS